MDPVSHPDAQLHEKKQRSTQKLLLGSTPMDNACYIRCLRIFYSNSWLKTISRLDLIVMKLMFVNNKSFVGGFPPIYTDTIGVGCIRFY